MDIKKYEKVKDRCMKQLEPINHKIQQRINECMVDICFYDNDWWIEDGMVCFGDGEAMIDSVPIAFFETDDVEEAEAVYDKHCEEIQKGHLKQRDEEDRECYERLKKRFEGQEEE